ncbi:unnamed protein product [Brassica napus]|uniref:(rape) hypothetical protein n=1 Tax=Brassica napus TaxID=3708 RepID=A0A816Y6K7_BRANA|nr:unnamed protein product [Brassica napus]
MVKGEEACWRLIHVGFVALAIESIIPIKGSINHLPFSWPQYCF